MSADPTRSARCASWFEEYRRTGDRRARNDIVEAHRDVAEHYAKRYARRDVPAEDLRQVALLAILRAVHEVFAHEPLRRLLEGRP